MHEGVTKFNCHHRPGTFPSDIDGLIRARNKLRRLNLIGVDEGGVGFGNVSARRWNGFVISGTQTGHLLTATARHFTVVTRVDIDANELHCTGPVPASSESMTHAAIYAAAPGVNAVVHIHNDTLWRRFLWHVPTTRPEAAYGTPEMAHELRHLIRVTDFLEERVAVMGGHSGGLVVIGESVEEAAEHAMVIADSSQRTAPR